MKSSFSSKFNALRKKRKLSVREIAVMTGASTKEVKKWEKGTSLPSDTRVMSALEGLLGEDISKEFSEINDDISKSSVQEYSVFSLDESIFKERRNSIGRLKEKLFPGRLKKKNNPTDYIKIETSEEVVTTEAILTVQPEHLNEEGSLTTEEPYINDPNQIVVYWKRNTKTFLLLILFLAICVRSFNMFWENISSFIDNMI